MSDPVRQMRHRGQAFIGMHAMNGSRQGLTMKRRFDEESAAVAEVDKLNAGQSDPAETLNAYPCLFTDEGVWELDAKRHWHMGRDRALRVGKRASGQ